MENDKDKPVDAPPDKTPVEPDVPGRPPVKPQDDPQPPVNPGDPNSPGREQ